MRTLRGPTVMLRSLALAIAPHVAATEPGAARASREPAALEVRAPVALVGRAPRAMGLDDGLDLMLTLPEGNETPYGRPNAWVYVPTRFEPRGPLDLVVVFHGFLNCLHSYTSPAGLVCTPGHPNRTGYDLARQIERAGAHSIVIIPQLSYDQRDSRPGKLGEPGALRDFLSAILERELAPIIGPHHLADVRRVAFMASSGGYQALEPALEVGDVPNVRDIHLLDAFYMYPRCNVEHWLYDHLDEFDPSASRPRRFSLIYTKGGGALPLSLAFKARAREVFEEHGSALRFTKLVAGEKPDTDDLRKPITILRAEMEHDEVVATYFWRILKSAGL